jgi:glycosyltransferase involved in cell wall biosynthesis
MPIPKVSVLMPNYNCEKYITEAIESILDQSFIDFEFIIIDDASTDGSWKIIQEYAEKDLRIIAMRNEENIGVHNTRNLLFTEASGQYYALFDSDDVAHIERLRMQCEFIDNHPDISLI